jgi:hypothetical protein
LTHLDFAVRQQAGVERMGFFSKDITSLDDLFIHTLQDIYYAERQTESSLPTRTMSDKLTMEKGPHG